jgi:hypothetical protein
MLEDFVNIDHTVLASQGPHLRTPKAGFNPEFTPFPPPPHICYIKGGGGGEPGVPPGFGVQRFGLRMHKLQVTPDSAPTFAI